MHFICFLLSFCLKLSDFRDRCRKFLDTILTAVQVLNKFVEYYLRFSTRQRQAFRCIEWGCHTRNFFIAHCNILLFTHLRHTAVVANQLKGNGIAAGLHADSCCKCQNGNISFEPKIFEVTLIDD